MRRKCDAGYTLLELIVVIAIIVILGVGIAVNAGPQIVSLDIDQVAAKVAASIARTRREALSGNQNAKALRFDLEKAIEGRHNGITFTQFDPNQSTVNNCTSTFSCSGQFSICTSGHTFCYVPSSTFNFESASGHIEDGINKAIFIISRSRKLAILINVEGTTEIAELMNGQWIAHSLKTNI